MTSRLRTTVLIILLTSAAVVLFHKKHAPLPPSDMTPSKIVTNPKDPQALTVFRTCQFSANDAFCTKYGPPDTIDKRHRMFLYEKERCGTLEPSDEPSSSKDIESQEPKSCAYTPSAPSAAAPASSSLPYLSLPAPVSHHP